MFGLDSFQNLLLKYKDKKFLVINPSGEKGDKLILMGMQKKLNELNINYTIFEYKTINSYEKSFSKLRGISPKILSPLLSSQLRFMRKFLNKKIKKELIRCTRVANVILIRGGAYLNDIWGEYNILRNILLCNPNLDIILAPHSFYSVTDKLREILKYTSCNTHVFCREKHSYNLISSMDLPSNVKIYLSHDTALYLNASDFTIKKREDPYVLVAPRKDREGVVSWSTQNFPKKVRVLFGDIEGVKNFASWVDIIGNSRKVYTDRLHVAIMSAILEKETFLYPNSYYKNKGVYEFSLCKFPNVRYVDSYEFLGVEP